MVFIVGEASLLCPLGGTPPSLGCSGDAATTMISNDCI